ncbi:MAG: flagellar basal-body MS-ring/collar protein FliF [Desulforhopalus sp.]|nr:flagellar basal-body MS-ring/collar protein FliF [Desulforhopalus sp.]
MAVETKSIQVPETAGVPSPEIVKPERKNLTTLIQEWPLSRKIATGAVLLIALALSVVLILQARTADQQLLYANLSMNDAGTVVNWLKNQKIEYSLRNDGKDIWVSANQLYQTRLELAANGLPSGGGIGFEVFDKQSFALSDYVQKVNYTRALQGELARTISSLAPVESTRVHLALPEKRLLKSQQKNATASVIVTLRQGKTLDKQQVQGIIHLVAGSVSDLEPDNVKVIDANGVVLEGQKQKTEDNLVSLDTLAFQREVEHNLEMRAQDLLDKTMGRDKAMVRVSAALDFSKVEKTQELFDADDPVIRSEQVNQESTGVDNSGGVPGVQSNLQGNEFQQSASAPPSTKNSRTTNFEISKTISKTVVPVGTIKKLSVSVLVADKVQQNEGGGSTTTTPRSPEEMKSIENMVGSAIGLVADRGDMINVLSMPFIDPVKPQHEGEQVSANLLYQYLPLAKYLLIALGMLILYFLLIRPVVKTMKGEVKQHYKTVEQLELEQQQKTEEEPLEPPLPVDEAITALRREVNHNQVPTAFILKNWIQEG